MSDIPPPPPPPPLPGSYSAPIGSAPVQDAYPPYGAYGAGIPAYMEYAGWWMRLGAFLIDGLILGIPTRIVIYALRNRLPTEIDTCTVDGRRGLCEELTSRSFAIVVFVAISILVLEAIFYYGYLEGRLGQTLGKRVVGIRVIDADTAQFIGMGRGIGRYFARLLSWLPCGLGYLWPLWDDRKQTFHDKIVRSVVVRT